MLRQRAFPTLRADILRALTISVALGACGESTVVPAGEECLPLDEGETECPSDEEAELEISADVVIELTQQWPERTFVERGVTHVVPGECCYAVGNVESSASRTLSSCHGFGRPLSSERGPLTAPAVRWDRSWQSPTRAAPRTDDLSLAARRQLGQAWLERGLCEHAAVASFARFTSNLLQLAAPLDLVQRSARATAEEVAHAALCFALAEAYLGEAWGPGALPSPEDASPIDAARFASRLALEGCILETIGVAELELRAAAAADPALRSAYRRLAREETRHAALGWQALQWISAHDPTARRAAQRTFAAFSAELPRPERRASAHPLASHGELSPVILAHAARVSFFEVITPAARAAFDLQRAARGPSLEAT